MIERIIEGRRRDLGDGFVVARVLPAPFRRTVGPFIFFDHFGPVDYAPGVGFDVRPHPHINLATVTYLFEGEIMHRDSLGYEQPIHPGAVNWMTAGRGIAHSERSSAQMRRTGQTLHGIQAWVALPAEAEEVEPSFHHHPADSLPSITIDGARRTLIAGTAFHAESPVKTYSPMFYIDVDAEPGATVYLPNEHEERAVYIATGAIEFGGELYEAGRMLIVEPGTEAAWRALEASRVMMLGGAPVGERHLWWNFVSSRPERIEQAKRDWAEGRFAAVPGETDFIPLPEEQPTPKPEPMS
jgi:redox-sensitive bicupin YhaK (pirin superfamily)